MLTTGSKRFSLPCLVGALLMVSGCGGGGALSDAVANKAPVAMARLTGEAVLNAATAFDTTGTADLDGAIASRTWAYGDGQTGSVDNHVYAAAGTYTATYTATDDKGASSSAPVIVVVAKCSAAGSAAAVLSPFKTVCVQTTRGEMVFEIYAAQAPTSAANFLKYAADGFYAGTLFHRVIPGFVIQAGGYTAGLVTKSPTYAPIALESANGLKNWQYTLAMARTPQPNSATSQFYINLVDNPALDYSAAVVSPNGYAVFGQVISGTAVVDTIGAVATTTTAGLSDVPVQDLVIRGMVSLP